MTFGYCEHSAPSFAKAGVIITGVLDDIQGGSRYGEHALELLKMSNSLAAASRTEYIVHTGLFAYTKPWRDSIKLAIADYDSCLRAG